MTGYMYPIQHDRVYVSYSIYALQFYLCTSILSMHFISFLCMRVNPSRSSRSADSRSIQMFLHYSGILFRYSRWREKALQTVLYCLLAPLTLQSTRAYNYTLITYNLIISLLRHRDLTRVIRYHINMQLILFKLICVLLS